MYKIGEKLAGRTAGVVSAVLLLVSPLYSLYSCTTLTEGLLVISLLAGLWYLIAAKERPKLVIVSAVFLLVASLTRYEGWWFVPFFSLWMLQSGLKGNRPAWIAMAIAMAGPVLWLGLNMAMYGNPFWFKSALAEYIEMYNADRPNFSLRGPLQLFEALVAFMLASVHAVPLSLAAFSSGVRKRAGRAVFLPLGLTVVYAGFLYYGFLSGSTQPYYRYGVPLAPFFFLLTGVLFSATSLVMRKWLGALGFVMLLVMVLMTAEVIRSGTGKPQIEAGRFLRELPEGKVLAPSPIVRLASGLDNDRFKDKMLGVDSRTLMKDRVRYIVAVESECDVADLADSLLTDTPGRPARARMLCQFTPPSTSFVFRFGTNAFTNSLSEHQGRVRVLELLF
jgi:4-amino-4-deoxy-L-arabinose transferase-like glycosyltransferase